jgi:hypothetical protein
MRRALPLAAAAAVAALALGQLPAAPTSALGPGDQVGVAAKAAQKKVRTPFALAGAAYGTRVSGGDLPAGSDDTAYQRIGCTNIAGDNRSNYEADLTIPGLGKVQGVRSRVWTKRAPNGRVSTFSSHSIARLTLASSGLGSLSITGINSVVEAFHQGKRFGTRVVESDLARINFTIAGQTTSFPIPAPGETLTIPGLAEISLGKAVRRSSSEGANITANVIDIKVIPLGTRARVAQTNASISSGVKQGVFAGYAAGLEARGLADNLKVGRTPLTVLPCAGTSSQLKEIANVDLGPVAQVSGVYAGTRANNRTRVARGTVAGQVAEISLLDGQVVITGIRGVATVTRQGKKLTRSSQGSTVLQITANGQDYSIPPIGVLEIPGLVKLEDAVTERTRFGLKVVGLRVTILDETGAVIDLGVAQVGIRPGVPARRR